MLLRVPDGLLMSSCLAGLAPTSVAAQDRPLPEPTGPHPVGIISSVLVDRQRAETFTPDPSDRREVPVRIWYPARSRVGRVSAYMPDSALWAADAAGYGGQMFARTRGTRTHAVMDASPLTTNAWPVAVFSPGNTFSPEYYTTFAEELASHGFVVAGLGVPYEASVQRLRDGTIARVARPAPGVAPFAFAKQGIRVRAEDLQFVLTQLTSPASLAALLPGVRTDARRTIVIGHSRGGVAAAEACKRTNRFRACLNLDGGVLGGPFYEDSTGGGARSPFLWLQAYHPPPSDSQLAAWKMPRMQWDSFDIRANRMLARTRGGAWRVVLPDSSHFQFSDLDWLSATDSSSATAALRSLLDVREIVRQYSQALVEGTPSRFTAAAIHARTLSFTRLPEAGWASVLDSIRTRLDSLLTGAWESDSTGGVVVGAIVGDSLIWTGVKGYADVRSRRPMSPAMTLRIGSITKQFTALMLLQLNERARVTLTDPLERFVPEARVLRRSFPNAPPITLYQLATHTSGLAREPDESTLAQGSSARWDTLVVRALSSTPVTAEPGTSYRYSNIGYALLGLALSRAAGQPYEEYVTTHILRPLGMEHTGFHAMDAAMLATGYDRASGDLDEQQPAQEHQGRGYKVPNGALYTTVADIARFIAFETGGGPDPVLSRGAVDENLSRIVYANRRLTDAAGLGFVLVRDGELTVYGHAGTVSGYDAITGFDPERRLGVVILRNVSFSAFDSYGLLLRVMRVLREGRRIALERPLH